VGRSISTQLWLGNDAVDVCSEGGSDESLGDDDAVR